MGGSIFTYIQQLEVLAFFSGYPLVFYFVRFVGRNAALTNVQGARLVSILPFAYALLGTLYIGLQIKNLYPDYSVENVRHRIQQPGLIIWAFLSVLFWIPALAKRQLLSVLHSLVFFLIIVRDLFIHLAGYGSDRNIVRNDMKIYTLSIVLNLASFIFLILVYFLAPFRKRYPKT